jgi:predicted metal-dependent hydrolase
VASKQIDLPEIGNITLYKRKSTSSIRLSVDARGQVKVTMPYWVPYEAGIRFARSRQSWIAEHQEVRSASLTHGQSIGKSHRLLFEASPVASKISSRVNDGIIRITHPAAYAVADSQVQAAAEKASIKALRTQAEDLLPGRLRQLADEHGFQYRSVQVKQLTGRWGSCDSHQNIVFNLYLMQLPWTLIDYVILHELTHTNILRHGPDFWSAMKRVLPDVQVRRKAMKQYRPAVGAGV